MINYWLKYWKDLITEHWQHPPKAELKQQYFMRLSEDHNYSFCKILIFKVLTGRMILDRNIPFKEI